MIDETLHEVKIVVYVDGVEFDSHVEQIPAFAVAYACSAAITQIQDPDLEAALEAEAD